MVIENKEDFTKELNKLRNHSILEISRWWGLRYAGSSGSIITTDHKLYAYQYYHIIPPSLKEKNTNFISKNKDLTYEEYNQVKEFIENEIIDIDFQDIRMHDAGFYVTVNYNGIHKTIKNNKSSDDNLMIYDKVRQLIDTIITEKN